ncbi:MAG: hypothetical protein ABJF89_14525 [Parasphingorhabdus sp.]|uniref:hypothetical protein n=1 Tax=Parasphingorhabdus sp. TaxID=2709688 RepID=UPI0032639E1D
MRKCILPVVLIATACSETPIDEQGDAAIAALEKQIEEEAQTLEEAAEEAYLVLEEDIDAELAADGLGAPAEVVGEQ